MSVQQREQLRKANLDIVHLKQELGIDDTPLRIDDTPAEDFERFLEESNQLTPKAVRAAELQYKASEDELLQQDFEVFMQQTGQLPVPKQLNAAAPAYSQDYLKLRSVATDIENLKSELGGGT